MQFKVALFVFLAVTCEIIFGQNYCSSSLCGTKKHIACNNNGNFASSCRKARMVTITQAIKNAILNVHNTKRNLVASGRTKLKPACRMATMQWNNELASLAALNVKQCRMKHDACRNTNTFKNSGQNLAMITTNPPLKARSLTRTSLNLWYREIGNTKMAQINSYPENYSGPAIGHFTVMVADQNTHVGCAISTFTAKNNKAHRGFLIACNYATTNIVGKPIYRSCATAASGCTSGKNTKFTSLCSKNERYNN